MAPVVEKITPPAVLGEGPHWDSAQNCFYYVSIPENAIFKYVPATGEHTKAKIEEGRVGFMVPVEGTRDQFVVGVERRFLLVQWDGADGTKVKVLRELAAVDPGTKNRLNDGKCDPRGRLFGGTMGHEEPLGTFVQRSGSLYRLCRNACTKMVEGVTISNGLAWDLKEKAFYYIDSPERKIRRYDYDVETGDISNMRYIFDFEASKLEGVPDGMTIDTDGNLWVACFEGSCVIKVDPRCGKLLQKVPIPALQVTSATFGGPDLDVLFVTTASLNISGEQRPPCGACFMVTGLGVKGRPNVSAKLD